MTVCVYWAHVNGAIVWGIKELDLDVCSNPTQYLPLFLYLQLRKLSHELRICPRSERTGMWRTWLWILVIYYEEHSLSAMLLSYSSKCVESGMGIEGRNYSLYPWKQGSFTEGFSMEMTQEFRSCRMRRDFPKGEVLGVSDTGGMACTKPLSWEDIVA